MNELLQKHGCSNVFTLPEGLKELMSDITREVLRDQPNKIYDFITNYLSVLLITREHGIMAVRILDDLCDCRPSVSEHLMYLGLETDLAHKLAEIINEEIVNFEPTEGKEKIKETDVLKKILSRSPLSEDMAVKVCQITRNAYRDYWYRKKLMEQSVVMQAEEPWEVAAERTLAIYKKTKPSFSELQRAAERIQAAYRGYHVRNKLLRHLKPKKYQGPKLELPGPPLDIAGSRVIDLGPVVDIKVNEDNVKAMFEEKAIADVGLHYDPTKTITNVTEKVEDVEDAVSSPTKTKATGKGKTLSIQADPVSMQEIRVIRVDSNRFKSSLQSARPAQSTTDDPIQRSSPRDDEGVDESGKVHRSTDAAVHRISFSVTPIVIPDVDLDEDEEIQEVLETIGTNYEVEDVQEVPEDIHDELNYADDLSSPTASAPSSGQGTAYNTDVEDLDK